MRTKRLAFLSKLDNSNNSQSTGCDDKPAVETVTDASGTEEQIGKDLRIMDRVICRLFH